MRHAISIRTANFFLLALSVAFVAAVPAKAKDYDITLLNVTDIGGGLAYGIDRGNVVGAVSGAALWMMPDQRIDLEPHSNSFAYGIWGDQQVGVGVTPTSNAAQHAILWTGTFDSLVDLNPPGSAASSAQAAYDGVQVGGVFLGTSHAALWCGTAASFLDLNPPGFASSGANAIWRDEIVGNGGLTRAQDHAIAWTNFAATSGVDIQPAGAGQSEALGVSHGQIVGWAGINGGTHAILWDAPSSTAFHDLNPAGATASQLRATNGTQQVGDMSTGPHSAFGGPPLDHEATVWRGTSSSFQMLPMPSGDNYSVATGIDLEGNISGYAGIQTNSGAAADAVPVLWTPHRLAGDANFDGTVNFADLLVLAQNYGHSGGWVDGDFNADGAVGFDDLLTLAQAYGQSLPAGGVFEVQLIPEPGLALLLTSVFLVCQRRRTNRGHPGSDIEKLRQFHPERPIPA